MSGWYFLNHWTFYYMYQYELDCLSKRLGSYLQGQVTVKDNMTFFNILSELLILLQLNLVWWYIIIRWIVLWKEVTEKVQNSSECSSGQYLLSYWTFCNQTWYGDATSWAKVSCKKIGLVSSSSGSQWGLIWSN